MRKLIFVLLCLILGVVPSAEASTDIVNAKKLFEEANTAYRKNDFPEAIAKYEKLIEQKNNSATVYYNLGNAYFKSGNLGLAILNYERAERLDRFDDDISHNLEYARKKTVDQFQAQVVISEKFFGILSAFAWKISSLVFVWIGFAALLLYLFVSNRKELGAYVGVTCILFAGITYWLGHEEGAIENKCHFRIVTNSEAYAKSSPDDSSTDLFLLHEGTKVQVFDEVGSYQKIRIADGRIGWVLKAETTKI